MKSTVFVVIALLVAIACAKDVKCDSVVYDPNTTQSYFFDLSHLHHGPQSYVDNLWYRSPENSIYYVNFCGQTAASCKSDDCSVCIRIPDGDDYKYVSGGSTSTQTITVGEAPGFSAKDSVTVTYSNGDACGSGNYSTKIYVICQENADPGYFYDYKSVNECETILYLFSAAGCSQGPAPPPTEFCQATLSQGGESFHFDLRPLHHDESSYVDTLWYRTPENNIYYVNFCGQTASACTSDDTSVCLRLHDGSDYKYVSAGSTSTQTFSPSKGMTFGKSITVTYSNGEKCGMGMKKTNLVVNCQEGANPGYFYDIDEISECESTLYMWSSAGCGVPASSSSTGSTGSSSSSSSSPAPTPIPTGFCAVTMSDEMKKVSYSYNLTSLNHDNQTFVDSLWYRSSDNEIYYVNFCGQTAAGCSSSDTSVCIRYPNGSGFKFVSGGSTSTQAFSSIEGKEIDEGVTVTYSKGEACGANGKITHLIVGCQKGADPGFIYDLEEINECEVNLYMWSAAGCGQSVPYVDPHH